MIWSRKDLFLQRSSKFEPKDFIALCGFLNHQSGKKSLTQLCGVLASERNISLSKVQFFTFWLTWLDPIGSIVTSIIIIVGGVKITKASFNILMEGTPKVISNDRIVLGE